MKCWYVGWRLRQKREGYLFIVTKGAVEAVLGKKISLEFVYHGR